MATAKPSPESDFAFRMQQDLKARAGQSGHAYSLLVDVTDLRCQVFGCRTTSSSSRPPNVSPQSNREPSMVSSKLTSISGTVGTGSYLYSEFVKESLMGTEGLWKAGLPPECCVQYLEERYVTLVFLSNSSSPSACLQAEAVAQSGSHAGRFPAHTTTTTRGEGATNSG